LNGRKKCLDLCGRTKEGHKGKTQKLKKGGKKREGKSAMSSESQERKGRTFF